MTGRRVVFDIESQGLMTSDVMEYNEDGSRKGFTDYSVWCAVIKDIDTEEKWRLGPDKVHQLPKLLAKCRTVIGHNILGFDLPVLHFKYGLQYNVREGVIAGKKVEFVDTLVLSKLLFPDRQGHGLEAWGKRLNFFKGDYGEQDEAWDKYSEEMHDYCEQDVDLNHKVYDALIAEWGGWDWKDAFQLEQEVQELATHQAGVGFYFDRELAEWAVEDLEGKLGACEEKVEPQLPEKPATKKFMANYIPPVKQVKKNLEPSSNLLKFLDKHGGQYLGDSEVELLGKKWTLPLPNEALLTKEPMTLASQTALKEYLIDLGWQPTIWNTKDITLDSKKRKQTREKFVEAVERYLEESENSNFLKYRIEEGGFKSLRDMKKRMREHDMSRPLRVATSPKFTDQKKEFCPSLYKLTEKIDFVDDVVKWLTYRHRRNCILSPPSDTKKQYTGWLTNPRLGVDGRIPTPVNTIGAATCRMTHIDIANIPRVSSLYGDVMRALFGVPDGYVQVGMDFDSLEAKIESHYCHPYDGTGEYCKSLTALKPNDIHTKTAEMLGIERDVAKSVRYGISYGAQVAKLAKMLGCSLEEAKRVFDDFWEAAYPLAQLKKRVEDYWETTGGKKFIKGLDGRKLWARSKHSLVNLLFQSAGAICAKRAAVWWWEQVRKENLAVQPLILYHDEQQTQEKKDQVKVKLFDTKEEAEQFKEQKERQSGKILSDVGDIDNKWYVAYTRNGELLALSTKHASDYYNMNVDLTGGYMIGKSWKDCH